jgi:hypothetical protein
MEPSSAEMIRSQAGRLRTVHQDRVVRLVGHVDDAFIEIVLRACQSHRQQIRVMAAVRQAADRSVDLQLTRRGGATLLS